MRIGALLGSGRTADVYAIDGDRVLRRYRDGTDAAGEAAVMGYLADRSYPVPAVDTAAAQRHALPPGDLVLRRLSGSTMLAALRAGTIAPASAGETLAGLLTRLHAIPARRSADPLHRVRHLDLHPDNVVLTPDGPMVIDWANTDEGPPGVDSALSALILAQAAVGTAEGPLARATLAALLRHLDPGVGEADLAHARAYRAANPTMTPAELRALERAVPLVRALLP
ncbi:phosphotransferase family enzyme [Murinocardiopsis flavida]|uniref:Phosphotransferase family enzyme n=1 Tax=Murinocardiopsis flavida TaxID=645275 RepID=A0A2P8DFC6_9ACTN|nr:phosphotransferase [Murinocardiopsis flavida]PSK95908.1 phosphotransferase family enzyme [Murinocardiopsis flavida]